MQIDTIVEFTNRQDAIELFNHVCEQGHRRVSLSPILAFVGPAGSGKSTLLHYLVASECFSKEKKVTQPYAYIDFSQPEILQDIYGILVSLRDQLWQLRDRDLHHFLFPRFDLAWLLLSASAHTQKLRLSDEDSLAELDDFSSRLGKHGEIDGKLNDITRSFSSFADNVRSLIQTGTLQHLIESTAPRAAWKWHRAYLMLEDDASVQEVLEHLYNVEFPQESEYAEQILTAALLADLREFFEGTNPLAWHGITHAILFLDGFEHLITSAAKNGIRLLNLLTFTPKHGESNPLLLVLGSRQRLCEATSSKDTQMLERIELFQRRQSSQQYIKELYSYWLHQLPPRGKPLELRCLYLEFSLLNFVREDIESYLQSYSRYISMITISDRLIDDIVRATYGHPSALRLVTEAISKAQEQEQIPLPKALEHVALPPELSREFLAPLSAIEQQELTIYAIPRVLPPDPSTLGILLQLAPDHEACRRWQHYRNLIYLSNRDTHSVALHPVLRKLLLTRLYTSTDGIEQYKQVHGLLQIHFNERSAQGDKTARVEEIYHALALGDPQPAIDLAQSLYNITDEQWDMLLETVAQAPTILLPSQIEAKASTALAEAQTTDSVESLLTALILYTWLLSAVEQDDLAYIDILHCLGSIYSLMTIPEQQKNIQKAIDYYDIALDLCKQEHHPLRWADLQQSLGTAYLELSNRDRQGNLEKAISHYEKALSVYTKTETPSQWAKALHSLGKAFFYFPGTISERQTYSQKALLCFEEALTVYDRQNFPTEWATIQRDLGNTYLYFPDHEKRQDLLQKAVSSYEAALQIYTRQNFPAEWALLKKDREFALIAMSQPGQKMYWSSVVFSGEPLVIISEANAPNQHVLNPGDVSKPPERLDTVLVDDKVHPSPDATEKSAQNALPRITKKEPRRKKKLPIVMLCIMIVIIVFSLFGFIIYKNTESPKSYIGVHKASNKEMIGISEGNFVFDTYDGRNTAALYLKQEAATRFLKHDPQEAEVLWQASLKIDPTDAETQIYLENQRVLDTRQPYLTIFIAITFGGGAYSSREIMQGSYIEQYQWNKTHAKGPLLRLLIANSGSDTANSKEVAQQITQQYQIDPSAIAVMGWPGSSTTLNAGEILNRAHIPMLSALSTADSLSDKKWSNFFRIVPLNRAQAGEGAKYTIKKYRRVALFKNPESLYSQNLSQDFDTQFRKVGGTVVVTKTYNPQSNYSDLLQDALNYQPDFIYFAGNSPDVGDFLKVLPTKGPFASLPVMTGDTAYALINYPNQQKSNLNRIFFTALADPNSWDWLNASNRKPLFFTDYPKIFGSSISEQKQYGTTSAGAYTILCYDATYVLLAATQQVLTDGQSPHRAGTLLHELEQIKGPRALQGVSGKISFNADHDAESKALVVVNIDEEGKPQIQSITGCFFVSDTHCSE